MSGEGGEETPAGWLVPIYSSQLLSSTGLPVSLPKTPWSEGFVSAEVHVAADISLKVMVRSGRRTTPTIPRSSSELSPTVPVLLISREGARVVPVQHFGKRQNCTSFSLHVCKASVLPSRVLEIGHIFFKCSDYISLSAGLLFNVVLALSFLLEAFVR